MRPWFAGEDIVFSNNRMSLRINRNTGWLDSYAVDGKELLQANAGQLRVFEDNEDPWSMFRFRIEKEIGAFALMDEVSSVSFASVQKDILSPLHVIENGDVRLCVEAFFRYNDSTARVVYKIPKNGIDVEMDITVYWLEKEKMLKCAFPTGCNVTEYLGQTAFGVNRLAADGTEQVAQEWIAVSDLSLGKAFALINNGVYGSSMKEGVLYQNLLRSTAYTGHPLPGRVVMMTDRFSYHIDQGERRFQLWLTGGAAGGIEKTADCLAHIKNQSPWALCAFPSGNGKVPESPLRVENARMDVFQKSRKWKRVYPPPLQSFPCPLCGEGMLRALWDLPGNSHESL